LRLAIAAVNFAPLMKTVVARILWRKRPNTAASKHYAAFFNILLTCTWYWKTVQYFGSVFALTFWAVWHGGIIALHYI